MKILFVVSGNHGAITAVVKNQGDALAKDGVEVDYYQIYGRGIFGYLRNVMPLRQYLRAHPYDAVHAHYSHTAYAASLAGVKHLVVSLMGSDVNAPGNYKFIIRLFAWLFRWRTIIVKSNDMYRTLGIKRAIVVPNGVNMERFQPMDKEECRKRLGWSLDAGRSEPEALDATHIDKKRVHILFPANVSDIEKDYALAEAAVKELESKILDAERLDPANADAAHFEIELHSFDKTPNEETPYWYNAADVVLMTSKWEGSPNAIKEAMACARPIVATNVGDIAERTSGVEGCYVVDVKELGNEGVRELAKAIEKALTFSSTQGRERIIADGLDARDVNKRLIALYQ